MGERVYNSTDLQIWVKPIEPLVESKPSFAIAYVNLGGAQNVS